MHMYIICIWCTWCIFYILHVLNKTWGLQNHPWQLRREDAAVKDKIKRIAPAKNAPQSTYITYTCTTKPISNHVYIYIYIHMCDVWSHVYHIYVIWHIQHSTGDECTAIYIHPIYMYHKTYMKSYLFIYPYV